MGVKPSQSKESSDESREILDTRSAINRLGGRRPLFVKVLRKFEPEHGKAVQDIIQHLAADDRKSASRVAHTVKGAAAAIGASELSHISAKLEMTIVDQAEGIDSLLGDFQQKLSQVFSAIEGFLEAEQTESAGPQGPSDQT